MHQEDHPVSERSEYQQPDSPEQQNPRGGNQLMYEYCEDLENAGAGKYQNKNDWDEGQRENWEYERANTFQDEYGWYVQQEELINSWYMTLRMVKAIAMSKLTIRVLQARVLSRVTRRRKRILPMIGLLL